MNGMALQLFGIQDYMKSDTGKEAGRSGSIQTQISFESILNTKKTDTTGFKAGESFKDSFPEASQTKNDQMRRPRWQENALNKRINSGDSNGIAVKDRSDNEITKANDDVSNASFKKDKVRGENVTKGLKKRLQQLEKAIEDTTDPQMKKELEAVAQEVKDLLQKIDTYANGLGNAKVATDDQMQVEKKAIVEGLDHLEETIQNVLKTLNPHHSEKNDKNGDRGNSLEGFGQLLGLLKSKGDGLKPADNLVNQVDVSSELLANVQPSEEEGSLQMAIPTDEVNPMEADATDPLLTAQASTTNAQATTASTSSTSSTTTAAISEMAKESVAVLNPSTMNAAAESTEPTTKAAEGTNSNFAEVVGETQNNEGQQGHPSGGNGEKNLKSEDKVQVRSESENTVKSVEISKFEPTLTKLHRTEQSTPMKRFENNIMNQIQQLMNGTLKINKGSNNEMTLKLKPESLGEVSLKLAMDANGELKADFKVENLMVKGILEGNMSELKNALQEKGYQVTKFDVTLSDNGAQQQGKNAHQQNHSRGNGDRNTQQSEFEQENITRLRMNDESTTIDSLV